VRVLAYHAIKGQRSAENFGADMDKIRSLSHSVSTLVLDRRLMCAETGVITGRWADELASRYLVLS
jgi:hypothetical protein